MDESKPWLNPIDKPQSVYVFSNGSRHTDEVPEANEDEEQDPQTPQVEDY
jgi:hypothetical protein